MGWGQTGPSLSPNCWLNHKWFIILSSLVSDWLNCVDSDTIQGKEMKGKVCWGQMASRKYFHPWLQKREWFERSELGLPLGELSCFQMFLWEGRMQAPLPPPFAPDECAADSLRLAAKREKSLSSSSLLICQANPQYTYLWTFSYTREVNAHIRWTTFSLAVCLLQEKHHVSWNQYSWTVLCLVSKPKGDQNLLLIVQLKTIHGFYLTSNTVWNVSMTWLPKFKKRKPTDWFTVCTNST